MEMLEQSERRCETTEPTVDCLALQRNLEALSSEGLLIPPRQLRRLVRQITSEPSKPLRVFIGTCPDYTHDGGRYTFEGLGDGVPLLTLAHLAHDRPFFDRLEENHVPFDVRILLADVEATDEFFCNRYTDDDEAKFLEKCQGSVGRTQALLDEYGATLEHGRFVSSSFFSDFGRDAFTRLEEAYRDRILDLRQSSGTLKRRISRDARERSRLYESLYGDLAKDPEFTEIRTIRTMAQYLAIGHCIAEHPHSAMILHETTNRGLVNDRNKFAIEERQQETFPVISLNRSVY